MKPEISSHPELNLFEDILNRGLNLRVKATGRSMSPFLKGGEILIIKKVPPRSLRIGDLIFVKTQDGQTLIHRIVLERSHNSARIFHTKGDAVLAMDDPVRENDIIGKVCMIEKTVSGGKIRFIDMEARHRETLNYIHAVISLAKSRLYGVVAGNKIYSSLRYLINKS